VRRGSAIFGSLFLAAAGPLILGHRGWALRALLLDAAAYAVALAGALWAIPVLFFGGVVFLFGLHVLMMIISARLPMTNPPSTAMTLLSLVFLIVIDGMITASARAELAEAFRIPAGSMIPTIQVGDHIYVDKRKTTPHRGDVIVFRYPKEPRKDFIKRVIAVGGDTVEWRDEAPVVNGTPLARKPLDGDCRYQDYDSSSNRWEERRCRAFEESLDGNSWRVIQDREPAMHSFALFTVPADSYYVLGDNRDNSHDSRYWGAVPADHVKGTAHWIWWSSGAELRSERIGQLIR
jgi:signal peptidase I